MRQLWSKEYFQIELKKHNIVEYEWGKEILKYTSSQDIVFIINNIVMELYEF